MTDARIVYGLDGKTYTVRSRANRRRIVGMTHALAHEGRSIREVVAELAARGIRRSIGTVSADLRGWTCETCSGVQIGPPEQRTSIDVDTAGAVRA